MTANPHTPTPPPEPNLMAKRIATHTLAKRTYTEAEKTTALALYATDGPTAVAQELGIPASTVVSWAKAAGVRTMRNERTAAAVEALQVDGEARRARLAGRLLDLAEQASELEFDLVKTAGLRDVVGARTRAIHDHQLLTGQATGRVEHAAPERTEGQQHELAKVLELVRPPGVAA